MPKRRNSSVSDAGRSSDKRAPFVPHSRGGSYNARARGARSVGCGQLAARQTVLRLDPNRPNRPETVGRWGLELGRFLFAHLGVLVVYNRWIRHK